MRGLDPRIHVPEPGRLGDTGLSSVSTAFGTPRRGSSCQARGWRPRGRRKSCL